MFLSKSNNKLIVLLLRCCLTIIFKPDYFLKSVDAINGVIWNKNTGNFVDLFDVKTFAVINERKLLISRELETHNFNGRLLKFTAFPIKNLVEFTANDTMVTGALGDSWQLISTILNFKLQCIKVNESVYGSKMKNGSWNGLIGYVYRNETHIIPRCVVFPDRLAALDYTLSPWRTTYRFYMKNQIQYHKTWMTGLLSRELWFFVIVLFLVSTIVSFTIHVLTTSDENDEETLNRKDYLLKLGDHVFYIFTIFCVQGWTPSQMDKRSKILTLSIRLFSWLLIIAFSSKLIAQITEYKFQSPFQDLKSFYKNTDYTLMVKRNSLMNSIFKEAETGSIKKLLRDSHRIIQVGTKEAYEKTCGGSFVFLETQDVVAAQDSKICDVRIVGDRFYTTWIAGGLVRGFKYKKTLNLGILKLHEFGITNRLRMKWLGKKNSMEERKKFKPIRFEHVSLIFAMFFLAALLSIFILLIENLVDYGLLRWC